MLYLYLPSHFVGKMFFEFLVQNEIENQISKVQCFYFHLLKTSKCEGHEIKPTNIDKGSAELESLRQYSCFRWWKFEGTQKNSSAKIDPWNILNIMQQMHYEQAVLKSKYDKLLSFLAEILDRMKYEERMTLEKNRPRCKYQNKGYCKQGQGCSFSHNSDICEEYLCSGSGNKGRVCHQRHPRKCKH